MNSEQKESMQTKISLKSGEVLNIYMSTPTLDTTKDILICIHGSGCDHRCYKPLFPYLEKEFQLIVPDFRGQGKSELRNPLNSLEDQTEEILLVMDYFGVKQASLFAWSAGCFPAVAVAALHPSRVKNLFLNAPSPIEGLPCKRKVTQPDGKIIRELMTEKSQLLKDDYTNKYQKIIADKDREGIAKLLKIDILDKDYPRTEDLDELVDQIMLTQDCVGPRWVSVISNLTDEKAHGVPGTGYGKKVEAPIYIFLGEKDFFKTDHNIDQLQRNFPTLKYIFNFDAPHGVHYYFPKEISDYMIDILKASVSLRPKL